MAAGVKHILEHPHDWCQVEALAHSPLEHDWANNHTFSGKAARTICDEAEAAWYRSEGTSKPRRAIPRSRIV
jgi:hypothetical protein